ncbi:MAG TPA: TolC family protein, partial [Thermoanaerobaculia bacterium]|nr:TolC family protein [Thermoanaerobaculia bacterium]
MLLHRHTPSFRGHAGRQAVFAAFLGVAVAAVVQGQEAAPLRLTLTDALTLAEQRGYDFLLADAAARGAEGDLDAARRLTNPVFSGAYLHSTGVPLGDTTTSASGYSLSLSDQGAIEGVASGKRSLRVRAAEAALAQARAGRDDALRVLRLQVTQAFYAVLAAEASERVDRDVAGTFGQTFDLVELRYRHGAVSEVDLARVETAKLEADQAVSGASGQVTQARAALAFLLGGIPSELELVGTLEGPIETWPSADPRKLIAEGLARRDDVRAAHAALDRADAALSLARRQRFPDLAVSGGYAREGPEEAPVTPPTVTLAATFELPVFHQRRGEIARAESDRSAAKIALDRIVSQATEEVLSGRAAFLAAREQVQRMTERLLDRARRARELVRLQYRAGAISLIDLLDAERTALSVELEYRQDLYALRAATAQLAAA